MRLAHLGWNPALNVHLHAVAYGSARESYALDAVPVVTPVGNLKDRAVGCLCRDPLAARRH